MSLLFLLASHLPNAPSSSHLFNLNLNLTLMDALKNALGSSSDNGAQQQQQQGGGGGGFTDSINSALGGGRAGERQEDYLDKGAFLSQPLLLV